MIKISLTTFLLLTSFFYISCSEKILYSGKMIGLESELYKNFQSKKEVIDNLGYPSLIDSIEKKYYYYSEKKISKNFFNKKISQRILVVFNFNSKDIVISVNKYDLEDTNQVALVKERTSDQILKKGLLESLFGGVGRGPSPTTP